MRLICAVVRRSVEVSVVVGVTLADVSGVGVGVSGVGVGDSVGLIEVVGSDVEDDGLGSANAGLLNIVASHSPHVDASTIAPACHLRRCSIRRPSGVISAASRCSASVS
ncbi:hypothetical protein A5733_22660 [Mycobacterium sp. NS-7484]|nr:hypothetical protein A5733_22660 [Mycobacterium sp. NS-7484]